MNCLVTGGCGFLGSHLVEKLVKLKHNVTVIDNLSSGKLINLNKVRNKIKFIKEILEIYQVLIHISKIEWVFHLAAKADIVPSIEDPNLYFQTNVTGTLNVLQSSRGKKLKKFIYIASSSSYGIPKIYPTPESTKCIPQYPYALTKFMGEQLVTHWSKVYDLPSISLRCFNIYGPRARTSGTYGAVMGVFFIPKIHNKPLTIVGDGKQIRDFTFVSDVVDAIIVAAKSKVKNEIFNIGSGNPVSVNYIANKISNKKIYIPKRPGEPKVTHACNKKIKKFLSWKPKVSIDKGLELMIENIKYWKDAPLWTRSKIKKATKSWFEHLK